MFDENQNSGVTYVWFLKCETKRFGLVTTVHAPSKQEALAIARNRYPKFAIQLITKAEYESVIEGNAQDRQANALAGFRLQTQRMARR